MPFHFTPLIFDISMLQLLLEHSLYHPRTKVCKIGPNLYVTDGIDIYWGEVEALSTHCLCCCRGGIFVHPPIASEALSPLQVALFAMSESNFCWTGSCYSLRRKLILFVCSEQSFVSAMSSFICIEWSFILLASERASSTIVSASAPLHISAGTRLDRFIPPMLGN